MAVLPNFVGIGAPRAGSSWLHGLLSSHPDVYMPTRRKEIMFFSELYDRGLEHYAGFFPGDEDARRFTAIGEITPQYLYDPACIERIAAVPQIEKLLLIVRNPIERTWSHYTHRVWREKQLLPIERYIGIDPRVRDWSLYAKHLRPWLERFGRERVLMLVHEHAVKDPAGTKAELGAFLGIDPSRFPGDAGGQRVGMGGVPQRRRLAAAVSKASISVRRLGLDWVPNAIKRTGLREVILGKRSRDALPPMSDETRDQLWETFAPDIAELEAMMSVDLSVWHS